jgi:hypothetical protein
MSFGSRATQAKPEALPSCSESSYGRSGGNADVSAREDFLTEIFFVCVRFRSRRPQQCGADELRDTRQNPRAALRVAASLLA